MNSSDIDKLITQIKKNDGTLTKIQLNDSFLGQSDLIKILKECKNDSYIEEIQMKSNFLGYESLSYLKSLIYENKNVKAIDIRYNSLSPFCLKEIVKALNSNFTILDFRIDEDLGEDLPFFPILKEGTSSFDTEWTTFTKKDLEQLKDKVQEIIDINKQIHRVSTIVIPFILLLTSRV